MSHQAHFTLTRKALLMAALSAIYPISAHSAEAGRIDFATGGVTATGSNGQSRTLGKGSPIESGDMIDTGDGRTQIRFSDGGLVSLQPNTKFRINEYSYDGKTDGSEKGFFSLIQGGLRALTGAIGHVNKKNYTIQTTVATIGIRGTEFLAQLNDILRMTCGEGICVLYNKGGELVLYAGESGSASDDSIAPISTDDKPNLPPAQNYSGVWRYSSAEDLDVNGNPCMITGCAARNQILPSVDGYVAAFASDYYGARRDETFTAQFNGSGQLTSLHGGMDYSENPYTFDQGSNALAISSGSDGIIAWGRWLGDVTDGGEGSPDVFGPNDGWHYVVGMPTAQMPVSGTATYTLLGATIPSSPTLGNGTFNGSLNVDFGTSELQTKFDVNFASGSASFAYNDTFAGISGYNFSGSGSTTTGTLCGGYGCYASFAGFFAGPDAARAGMSYQITGGTIGSSINGTAAFTRAGTGSPIPYD